MVEPCFRLAKRYLWCQVRPLCSSFPPVDKRHHHHHHHHQQQQQQERVHQCTCTIMMIIMTIIVVTRPTSSQWTPPSTDGLRFTTFRFACLTFFLSKSESDQIQFLGPGGEKCICQKFCQINIKVWSANWSEKFSHHSN